MAKKKLKKLLKAALIGGAGLLAARGLGKKRLGADKLTEGDIGIGQRAPIVEDAPYITKKKPHFDYKFFAGKKGGRAAAKHGGRTSKQFGGGLNRPAGRPVGGVGAPIRPLGYKKGGHVKSMGAAKRGGGVAKK